MKITLAEIAKLTGSELDGDPDYVIEDAAGIEEAGENQISFLENPKYASRVSSSKAGGIFLSKDVNGIKGGPKNKLFTDRPKWAYGEVLKKIHAEKWPSEAVVISDKAEIHFEAHLGKDVSVGAFAVIKGRTLIGKNTKIAAQCHIGYNARIGEDCVLHPQVVIGDFCELGDRVEVHPGSIIGGEGYAYWTDKKTGVHHKIPQVGRVVLENDVEVGSNVTIDRAATGETRIGEGTKIDNLVQIGHNVSIGRNGLVISQVGISGSTKAGNQVIFAGQAGIIGHLTIGDGAIITAQTGVMGDVKPGEILFGSPARPHREAMKLQAIFSKLPDIYRFFKKAKSLLPKEEPRAK